MIHFHCRLLLPATLLLFLAGPAAAQGEDCSIEEGLLPQTPTAAVGVGAADRVDAEAGGVERAQGAEGTTQPPHPAHPQPEPSMPPEGRSAPPPEPQRMPGQGHEGHGAGHEAEHGAAGALQETRIPGLLMNRRMGSGTSWQPDASPMFMLHWPRRSWDLMLMGNAFLDYAAQGGPRGFDRIVSQNWAMGMANRRIGSRGDLMLRLMLSLEPATVGDNGVPELFQTGEGLIDRQHPHDLFMEIAAQYTHRLNRNLAWSLYLAPVGEPALGPVAYPHRISAWDNPQTPLAHHLQDSTHIAYGVITAGLQGERWKLEGSWFNAREPDSKRWAFDPMRLNSPSVRLWYNPSQNWSFQVSRGWLKSPEQDEPGDLRRTTASATYVRELSRGYWSASFLWGRNDEDGHDEHGPRTEDSFGLEAVYNWADRNYLFGRVERLDRDGLFERGPLAERLFTVNAFTLGYQREIGRIGGLDALAGASATFYGVSSELRNAYGDFPVGVHVFLRLRPGRMRHEQPRHGTETPGHQH